MAVKRKTASGNSRVKKPAGQKFRAGSAKPWAIGKLRPNPLNTNRHSEEQVAMIARSMERFGVTFPILADATGEIVAGEGRWLAAKYLAMAEYPVIVADGWSKSEIRAYIIADNQIARVSEWDFEKLKFELDALTTEGWDMATLGFDPASLADIMADPEADGGKSSAGSLAERFGIPPFSVFTAQKGWWQSRKEAWLALGIKSEIGRGAAPGGSLLPGIDPRSGKIERVDSRGRMADGTPMGAPPKRGRGRPRGSKSKPRETVNA